MGLSRRAKHNPGHEVSKRVARPCADEHTVNPNRSPFFPVFALNGFDHLLVHADTFFRDCAIRSLMVKARSPCECSSARGWRINGEAPSVCGTFNSHDRRANA